MISISSLNGIISEKVFYGDDDLHIKVFPVLEDIDKYVLRLIPIYENEDKILERLEWATSSFIELRQFGIFIPKFMIIKTKVDHSDKSYFIIITELIEGISLPMKDVTERNQTEFYEQVTQFLNNLINYCKYKYQLLGRYPVDLLPHQFVYGRNFEGELGIYWVDLGPLTQWINPEIPDSILYFFKIYLGFIAARICDFEDRCNTRLSSTRESLSEFLLQLQSDNLFKDLAIEINSYLE